MTLVSEGHMGACVPPVKVFKEGGGGSTHTSLEHVWGSDNRETDVPGPDQPPTRGPCARGRELEGSVRVGESALPVGEFCVLHLSPPFSVPLSLSTSLCLYLCLFFFLPSYLSSRYRAAATRPFRWEAWEAQVPLELLFQGLLHSPGKSAVNARALGTQQGSGAAGRAGGPRAILMRPWGGVSSTGGPPILGAPLSCENCPEGWAAWGPCWEDKTRVLPCGAPK